MRSNYEKKTKQIVHLNRNGGTLNILLLTVGGLTGVIWFAFVASEKVFSSIGLFHYGFGLLP